MRADPMQDARAAQEARAEARAAAEMARAQAEIARVQAEQARGELRDVRVERSVSGQTVVHLPDGRTVTIDRDGPPTTEAPFGIPHEAVAGFPQMPFEERGPPENVIVLTAVVLFFLALMVVGWPLARAFGRRVDRRTLTPGMPDLDARLQRIEQAVETVAVEVERISESQRFSARLLAERAEPQASYGAGPTRLP